MAKYIPLYTKTFSDRKFRKLSKDGTLLFFALGWNENVALCGIYEPDFEVISLYSKVKQGKEFDDALKELERIMPYDEESGLIFVKNRFKYQPKSPAVITSVIQELNFLPTHKFKDEFLKIYGIYLAPFASKLNMSLDNFYEKAKQVDKNTKQEYLTKDNLKNLMKWFNTKDKLKRHLLGFGFTEHEIEEALNGL